MKFILIPLTTILFFLACQPPQTETKKAESRDTAKKNYLPVADYILSEIADVDSTPFRILRYRTINGMKDSGIITTAVFDQIAREFLKPELDSSRFEKIFQESSFMDQSTEKISFSYSTKDTVNGLKRVDILLSPGPISNKLSSIYMESIEKNKDSTLISKLSWKAGQRLSILHIRNAPGGPETTDQTLVVWDSRD